MIARLLVLAVVAACLLAGPAGAHHDGDVVLQHPGSAGDVEIVYDAFGVGHVFADDPEAAMFGLGYLHATQKLWLMQIVRLQVKGDLSDLLGPAGTETDRATMLSFQYPPDVRAALYQRMPDDVKAEFQAFADGVNHYLEAATTDPDLVPQELVATGFWPMAPWTPDDSFAATIYTTGDPVGGVPSLRNTRLLARLVETYGQDEGMAKFSDLVRRQDPDQPTAVPRDYAYREVAPLLDAQEADRHRVLTPDNRDLTSLGEPAPAGPRRGADGLGRQLALVPSVASVDRALADVERLAAAAWPLDLEHLFGSNAQIVGPQLSATGNSLLTSGPQTTYNAPAVYYQFGVHVPGVVDFTGVGAPSIPYPFAARTATHAWTVTSGLSADYVDWYVERLDPADPRAYLFNGAYEPMACREEQHAVRGVPTETQEICWTRHGPVLSFDEANGVAYTQRRPYYGREDLFIQAFRGMVRATDPEQFGTAVMSLPTTWNFFYADDAGTIAYWYSGFHPQRRPGVDLRLVMDGTGADEWLGVVAPRDIPHAVNPPQGWLGSWNNAPAGDWPQAYTQPARHRFERLQRAFADGPGTAAPFQAGGVNPDGGRWDAADLWRNLQHAAYADFAWTFRSALPPADALGSDLARAARALVEGWDGLHVDRDGDGRGDAAARTIAHAWLNVAVAEAFADDLPAEDLPLARRDGELWHVLSPDSTAALAFDWLNGESREAFAARTFQQAVEQLAAERGNDDPSTWRSGVGTTRYAHVGLLHLGIDAVRPTECGELGLCAADLLRDELGLPVLTAQYVAPHPAMSRGVFNGTVAYLDPPGARGTSRVQACSVLTPGQDGHIGPDGQPGPHFADQRELYVDWQLHDWPVTRDEVMAAKDGRTCTPLAL